jgi:hypothetical protein
MRNYINLLNENFIDDDENDDEMMAGMDREKHIEKLIRFAFNKIGLEIGLNSYSVSYEDSTRNAEVQLEETSITLDTLLRLRDTGLSDNFTVEHGADALSILFKASPDLDHAAIPEK